MYERLTDRARTVMQLANGESRRLNREFIETDCILLACLLEGSGVAAQVLRNSGLSVESVRCEIRELFPPGPDVVTMGSLPETTFARNAIYFAIGEAFDMSHNYVGTEHILLGLLREPENPAARVLKFLGLTLEELRETILELLGSPPILRAFAVETKSGPGPTHQEAVELAARGKRPMRFEVCDNRVVRIAYEDVTEKLQEPR